MKGKRVITVTDLASVTGTLVVPPGSIVTPAARDLAAEKGIHIIFEDVESHPTPAGRPLVRYSKSELASRIDHTNLAPDATEADIQKLCDEAIEHGFATVCVNPIWVSTGVRQVSGSSTRVCAVVGFPSGTHPTDIKSKEASLCIQHGAQEIDVVACAGWLKGRNESAYYADLLAIRTAIGHGITMKVIIEASLLNEDEVVRAGTIAAHSGADFVKTSTGVYGRTRVEDVRLLRRVLPAHMNIKAAGGIRTLDDVVAMLGAGACRIGTSTTVSILESL